MNAEDRGVDFATVLPRGRGAVTRIFFDDATPDDARRVRDHMVHAHEHAHDTTMMSMSKSTSSRIYSGDMTYTIRGEDDSHRCEVSEITFVNQCEFGRKRFRNITVACETRRTVPVHLFPTSSPDAWDRDVETLRRRVSRSTHVVVETHGADGADDTAMWIEAREGADQKALVHAVLWVRKILLGEA